jgi:hypothetical protein
VRRLGLAALALGAVLTLVLAAGRAHSASPAPQAPPQATVVYYFIPGCAVCARTSQRLQQLVAGYGARVAIRLVDCTSGEGVAAVRRHGFRSHGLVLLDASARPQLVESDHRVFPEHVAEALERILPASSP